METKDDTFNVSTLAHAVLVLKGEENTSIDDEVLGKLQALLIEVVPHLLAKNGSKHHVLEANTYQMQLDSLLGLTWKMLRTDQLPNELGWLKTSVISSLDSDVFAKVRQTKSSPIVPS